MVQIFIFSLANVVQIPLHVRYGLFVAGLCLVYICVAMAKYGLFIKFIFLISSTLPVLFMIVFSKTVGDVLYLSITTLIVNVVAFLSLLVDYILGIKAKRVITLHAHRYWSGIVILMGIVVLIEVGTLTRIEGGTLVMIGNVQGALMPTDLPPEWGIAITLGCIGVLIFAYWKAKSGGVTDRVNISKQKKGEAEGGQSYTVA